MRDEIRVDRVALLFTLAVSILTGLIFGLAPGWQAARDRCQRVAERGRAQWRRGQSARASGLVIVEIALALALLVGPDCSSTASRDCSALPPATIRRV